MADQSQGSPNLRSREHGLLAKHLDEIPQHSLDLVDMSLISAERDIMPTRADADVVLGFERSGVLIVTTEQGEMIQIRR